MKRLVLVTLCTLLLLTVGVQASAETTLTVMTGLGGERASAARALLEAYGQERGVKVELIDVPWVEILDKAATMTAGGTPPDVLRLDQSRVKSFAAAGLIADLSPWVQRDAVSLDRFPRGSLDMFRGKNFELQALPSGGSVTVTYYNKAHFAEAGLVPPTHEWSSEEWLWEDFVQAAHKLTRVEGEETSRFGLSLFGSGFGQNQIGLWDLNWVDDEGKTFLGTTPDVLDAMDRILTLWTEYRVIPGPGNPGHSGDGFANQWASMAVAQDWLLQRYHDADYLEFAVAPVPKGSARLSQVGVQAFSVVKQSAHQQEAWELVKYLTYDPEGAKAWTRITTEVPSLVEIGPDFVEYTATTAPDLNAIVLVEAMLNPWNWRAALSSQFGDIYSTITRSLESVILGERALRTVMEEIRPTIEAGLAKD